MQRDVDREARLEVHELGGGGALQIRHHAPTEAEADRYQARVLELVTDDRPMEGGPAPTMGMRVPNPAIVTRFVNQGDRYARYGIGWLLIGPGMTPSWAADHPDVWAGRETLECFEWGSGPSCLVRVP